MSTPASGPPAGSPLRTAGVALVGLALVLAVIGVLAGTSDDTPAASFAGPSITVLPTAPRSTVPPTTPAPTTTAPPTPAPTTTVAPTTTAAPTSAATSTVPPTTAADPRATVDVVVLNNSTVGGLASRAAEDVRGAGWTVVEVGNYTGLVPTTTVYYRPGTAEEAAARALAADTGARVEPRFAGLPSAADGVVLVVTSDYAG